MTTFREFLLDRDLFVSGLAQRGFTLDNVDAEYENDFAFTKRISKHIHVSLHFTPWGANAFRCGVIISSTDVTDIFHGYGLFLDRTAIPEVAAYGVLATELLWLKWNEDPESAEEFQSDYGLENDAGVQRFFEDLDGVGNSFLLSVNTPRKLADFLVLIEHYPIRIKWGGQPKSSDPFIFASALYLALGAKLEARKALEVGFAQYAVDEPRAPWQEYRLEKFRARRDLLLAGVEKTNESSSH